MPNYRNLLYMTKEPKFKKYKTKELILSGEFLSLIFV